nr:sulfate ABC transporter substrate-binding protein [Clostridium sp. E02]
MVTGVSAAVIACGISGDKKKEDTIKITNVSYDPTREFYEAYDEIFQSHYKRNHKMGITVIQSHGGSGSQARSVMEGAPGDVVTLALAQDVKLLERAGMIDSGWINEFEGNSSPYTSIIVFLVRKGNEKNIRDWEDLRKAGVEVITPDPKSSGGACWNFLAAWQYAKVTYPDNEKQRKEFMKDLYDHVTVMDSGSRGSTTTYVENGQGDVLIAWENEALNTTKEYPGDYEIVTPKISIKAEPSVAVVDENVKNTRKEQAAKEYLQALYSEEAQKLIAAYGYRPYNKEILKQNSNKFDLSVSLGTIYEYGGWDKAYETFFTDGGIFDEIYGP